MTSAFPPLRTHAGDAAGFLSWSADVSVVERALGYGPDAVMLSFGDPGSLAAPVLAAGVPLIVQVTDVDEAEQALEVGPGAGGAGQRGGGHGGRRATLPFVTVVVDLAAPTPVLAARGRRWAGPAAALVLGAAGALIGTRSKPPSRRWSRPKLPRRSSMAGVKIPSGAE